MALLSQLVALKPGADSGRDVPMRMSELIHDALPGILAFAREQVALPNREACIALLQPIFARIQELLSSEDQERVDADCARLMGTVATGMAKLCGVALPEGTFSETFTQLPALARQLPSVEDAQGLLRPLLQQLIDQAEASALHPIANWEIALLQEFLSLGSGPSGNSIPEDHEETDEPWMGQVTPLFEEGDEASSLDGVPAHEAILKWRTSLLQGAGSSDGTVSARGAGAMQPMFELDPHGTAPSDDEFPVGGAQALQAMMIQMSSLFQRAGTSDGAPSALGAGAMQPMMFMVAPQGPGEAGPVEAMDQALEAMLMQFASNGPGPGGAPSQERFSQFMAQAASGELLDSLLGLRATQPNGDRVGPTAFPMDLVDGLEPPITLRVSPGRKVVLPPSTPARTSPGPNGTLAPTSPLRTSPSQKAVLPPTSPLRTSAGQGVVLPHTSPLRASTGREAGSPSPSPMRTSPGPNGTLAPTSPLRTSAGQNGTPTLASPWEHRLDKERSNPAHPH